MVSATSMARSSFLIVVGLVVPAAHRGVVGDDQALGVGDLGQRHDHPAPERVAGLQAGQRAQLENGSAGVDQGLEPLAHHHLAARDRWRST